MFLVVPFLINNPSHWDERKKTKNRPKKKPPVAIPPLQPGRLPLCLTIEEVGAELRRLQSGKAAGPDGVCPRLLRDCAGQLEVPLQRLLNMSLQMEKVPVL